MQSFGLYGNSADDEMIAIGLGIRKGLVLMCWGNLSEEFFSLAGDVIKLPIGEEWKALCEYGGKNFGLPNCFFVDGSTHILAEVPGFNKDAFFERKQKYSLHLSVTSDHCKKVIIFVAGLALFCS